MDFGLTQASAKELEQAVQCCDPVEGFTHDYYRYPARFSPRFSRIAIKIFSEAGDVVFDPFMGGGTTLVEAFMLGRFGIGTDISSLAAFLADVKVTPQPDENLRLFSDWVMRLPKKLNLHRSISHPVEWISKGYLRNINCRETWRVRKLIEMALLELEDLPLPQLKKLARCLVLRTSQWALDCRERIPSAEEFREQLIFFGKFMIQGASQMTTRLNQLEQSGINGHFPPLCLNRSVIGIEEEWKTTRLPPPRLILTSPPYPGVHVLYHRWQVGGRRETPAPFWIAECVDGNGAAYYTFGDRKQIKLKGYFNLLRQSFQSLSKISVPNTCLMQLVSFSEPEWQLEEYLQAVEDSGFAEVKIPYFCSADGRLWRNVPNRKFYASHRPTINSAKEVLLIHRYAGTSHE